MDWREALMDTIELYLDKDCEWGVTDCCQFASEYWARMTGVNHAELFDYNSQMSAAKILVENGGIVGLFTRLLGPPGGDLVPGSMTICALSDDPEILAPGVWNGHWVFTIHPDKGLWRVPREHILEIWSCPQQQ